MHRDTIVQYKEVCQRASDRNLLNMAVTVEDLGGELRFMAFMGIVVDESETVCAVVSDRKNSPFCRLIHWTRIRELDVMWKG